MNEDFLQYIWQQRLYSQSKPQISTEGEDIEIIDVGTVNDNAGPDFFNAKIKINNTIWAGNVEIHVYSSHWEKHEHHVNNAYNNVILQVVHKEDKKVYNSAGKYITTLEIDYDRKIFENYRNLLTSRYQIPCARGIEKVDKQVVRVFIHSLMIERLCQKAEAIDGVLTKTRNDWDETFYRFLARSYGFNLNSLPFEMLARSLKYKILFRHLNDLKDLESLLFGQAGFLNDQIRTDDYHQDLKRRYRHFQKAYQLNPVDDHLWKFLRLRPSNFPTIRIAQFAGLLHNSERLFSRIVDSTGTGQLINLFRSETSVYWRNHYIFGKETRTRPKKMGKASIDIILINTVVPFLFVYGMKKNDEEYKRRALNLLEQIPAEKNSITKMWKELGMEINDAFHSQAFIQLKKNYCDKKNCLRCQIGYRLINKT